MEQIIARFEKNTKGRDFVCGDIHGCFDELEAGLQEIAFDTAADRMFCVGDLIDRGPRCPDALPYYHKKDWFYTVLGNHEDQFSRLYTYYGRFYSRHDYVGNGSRWSAKQSCEYLDELQEAVRDLPWIIKVDDALILHARLPDVDNLDIIEAHPEDYMQTILWQREGLPNKIAVPGITRVYCGHTVVAEPFAHNGTVNIDTGAFLKYRKGITGKLTIVML